MCLSWVMAYENIPYLLSDWVLSISQDKIVILLIINVLLIFVGFFMDITPAVLIFTPIFLPVVTQIGIDPVHFGMMMILNLCIGLCTPPVGSVLFVGVGVSGTTIQKIIKPMIPFLIAMLITLLLVTIFPDITLWLPGLFK